MQWITCPATGEQCNDYCDPGKGDTCAASGEAFGSAPIIIIIELLRDARDTLCQISNQPYVAELVAKIDAALKP